ncbi:glycerol-3-phosphate acyltransferase [Jeotgalibacillus sp. R-1-5s-1]|uniref:glycerol-3-phosphate acyltransferase n=1 Tax=Jeotgalibacillus sp. R-1-5s-1 TaxID=2555897 RepID=UPI00106C88C1|nr:glycerol-3-phosphate acyltransferase [Jeotgalibacillus sp. R-1-5s-1]TFE00832.1 glycerol-3-phosphate acyltransferase [Jeotgalibacillus sp. R-1-5s-1]
MTILMAAVIPYLFGCINGAYYLTKWLKKQDIRELESGNAGATNAGRVMGKTGFLLTLLIDAVKTWLALWLVTVWFDGLLWPQVVAIAFVLLGHLYPAHLQFRGGKGIVVFLAGAFWLQPLILAVLAGVMAVVYGLSRRYTISGFIAIGAVLGFLFYEFGISVVSLGMSGMFLYMLLVYNK